MEKAGGQAKNQENAFEGVGGGGGDAETHPTTKKSSLFFQGVVCRIAVPAHGVVFRPPGAALCGLPPLENQITVPTPGDVVRPVLRRAGSLRSRVRLPSA